MERKNDADLKVVIMHPETPQKPNKATSVCRPVCPQMKNMPK
jgi:hypothetical protein